VKYKMAMIHVYTGEGEGKTLTALGLALRAIGHGKKVIMIQFMKGWKETGEYMIKDRLEPEFEIYQFGRREFVNLKNPEKTDIELARKGFEFAKKILKKNPDILILDEINLAISIGLLDLNEIINFLKRVPDDIAVVMTGRRAPREIIDMANLVTEMKYIKHPFDKGIAAREGLDY